MINKHDKRYRQYLAICKRLDEIWDIKRKIPWRQLPKPEHAGWTVFFTLTPGGMHRQDSEKYLQIISYCDKGYHIRKDNNNKIVSKLREAKRFEDMKKLFMFRNIDGQVCYGGPSLSHLNERQYKELPEILQRPRFFEERITGTNHRWGGVTYTYKTYHHRIPDSILAIKVRKRMYTHIRDIDPILEREESYLEDKRQQYMEFDGRVDSWGHKRHSRIHARAAIRLFQKGGISEINEYKKLSKQLDQ